MGSCLANANSKIFFACGANKKAFGQIDQPKGTKPREIRTLGVHCKGEVLLCLAGQADQADQEDQEGTTTKRYDARYIMSESVDSTCLRNA